MGRRAAAQHSSAGRVPGRLRLWRVGLSGAALLCICTPLSSYTTSVQANVHSLVLCLFPLLPGPWPLLS